MTQIKTADFKNGITLQLDSELFQLTEFQHVNPGKGAAFVRTRLKNVRTGAVLRKTFRAGERVEQVMISSRDMQLLYVDGDEFVLMDNQTFDQVSLAASAVGDAGDYLLPGSNVSVSFHGSEPIGAHLPASVELPIADTEPGIQGDRVSGGTKPAKLATGKTVAVPLFVESGDTIVVDTRTGEYMSRV